MQVGGVTIKASEGFAELPLAEVAVDPTRSQGVLMNAGGGAFAHDSLKGLFFSLGLAFLIGLVIEGSRRIAVRRGARATAAKTTAG